MSIIDALKHAINLLEVELMFETDSRHLPEKTRTTEKALETLTRVLQNNLKMEGK
jgi:hypothetical protein